MIEFQPTLPARGATWKTPSARRTGSISTHAPRTGSDTRTERQGAEAMHFNPRSPHGERRGRGCFSDGKVCRFQPTLPARGATVAPLQRVAHVLISTHAPRTGSDDQGADTYESFAISTHAPRTGSDVLLCCVCRSPRHFNPRSPHGERRGDSYDVHEPRRFQPTLPARGATRRPPMKPAQSVYFNPRSPHGERRAAAAYADSLDRDFNPRSPHGERLHQQSDFWLRSKFQPTLPARGATNGKIILDCRWRFQPTLPARGATHSCVLLIPFLLFQPTLPARGATVRGVISAILGNISTHAPRTGSDLMLSGYFYSHYNFNPRSPHGERLKGSSSAKGRRNFNPRSPHGERHDKDDPNGWKMEISTHAPRTGSDSRCTWKKNRESGFQPTLPARGATFCTPCPAIANNDFNPRSPHGERLAIRHSCHRGQNFNPRSPHGERLLCRSRFRHSRQISTHAPRTGSDPRSARPQRWAQHFNPRSPHGERLDRYEGVPHYYTFQPTLPARGATRRVSRGSTRNSISTHAPRTGSDEQHEILHRLRLISTHAPRTGSDAILMPAVQKSIISTHAPRTGSDMVANLQSSTGCNFNPRSPHGERRFKSSSGYRPAERISTHAPRTGSDIAAPQRRMFWQVFQPTLPARGATKCEPRGLADRIISTHAPRTGSDIKKGFAPGKDRISTHAPRTGSDARKYHRCRPLVAISTHAPRTGSDRRPRFLRELGRDISTHAPRTGSDALLPPSIALWKFISTHAPRTGSDSITPLRKHQVRAFQPTLPARGATASSCKSVNV